MAATLSQIKGWLARPHDDYSHMIVKCSGFGDPTEPGCCYPVYVAKGDDPHKVAEEESGRTMEVYSFTGKHTVEAQLRESRAFHYD